MFVYVMTCQHLKSKAACFWLLSQQRFRSHPHLYRHFTKMFSVFQMYTAFLITKSPSEMQIQGSVCGLHLTLCNELAFC